MKWIITACSILFIAAFTNAQSDDSITARFVLVGDAGALVNGRAPVLDAVREFVPLDKKTTVVYLGDNLYREGLPDEQFSSYWQHRAVLDTQVALVNNTKATAYFIPGNHDWMNGNKGGVYAINRQQRYIDQIAKSNVKFYPKDGCPGPIEVKINDDVVLVIMDSQWWLHQWEKPGVESDCPYKTKEAVLNELQDILALNEKKLVLFAFHHPFKSNGIHGGYFTIKQHIFPFTDLKKNLYIPLPLLGSIYPISRGVFGSPQDVRHPTYVEMSNRVGDVVKQHHYTIFMSGHEHNLQYFADENFNYIISGSGCKTTRVAKGRNSEFVAAELGFALIEVSSNRNVILSFYTVVDGKAGLAFRKNILNFTPPPVIKETIPRTTVLLEFRDSVLAPASLQYRKSGPVRRLLFGENYRNEWSEPVMFAEFKLSQEKGGMEIISRGGGKQTKSLTLKDNDGNEWSLRTIDKDAGGILPEQLRHGPAQNVVQEMISASHPYAPLAVPPMAEAVGVVQASPEIYFVPDDPAFGIYRKVFANKICYLERKDPVPEGVKTKSTDKFIRNMLEDNDNVVDQRAVLKARLLDIMIGDFDRHFDQWKWAVFDTGRADLYKPIAKDRDQAFFHSDGKIIDWVTKSRMPFLRGLKYDLKKIKWMGFASRDFDRIFLNQLNEKDWEETVKEFKQDMKDSVIVDAVHRMPQEIYNIHGDTIVSKLKSRRDKLEDAMKTYYRFLARDVNILGSNKPELFKVIGTDSGTWVKVYARKKYSDTSLLVYNRLFDNRITKELRLYGLNGNDIFQVEGKKGMRLRMIGGKGIDTFNVDGGIKSIVYDLNTEPNFINKGTRTKDRMSADPHVNDYSIHEFQYEIKRLPRVNIGFNTEDGFMFGLGYWIRTFGFRKDPYESDNKLTTLYSFFDKAYNIRYRGEFNSLFRSYDALINADYYNPVINNFFGLGNNTNKSPDTRMYFYRVRYKYLSYDLQVRKRLFNGKLGFSLGPSFYHYWMREKDNRNRILENPESIGFDSSSVYGVKTYIGGKFDFDINNTNNEFYPTRGINWNSEIKVLQGINSNSEPLIRFQSDMTIYGSLADYAKLLAILRLGGGHIFNNQFEYFQALNIGANNFLRGFRKNRFSGSSMAYVSLEMRYKLLTLKSNVIPGSFGLVAFDDIGRVWVRNETSNRWHNAIGGGVFFLPFDLMSIAFTVASSVEETLFNFSLGTRFNIYF